MKNIFNSINVSKPRHNTFDLSHDRKFSFTMGNLTPCLAQEVIPGDKFTVNTQQMIRLAPLVAPMMHKVDVYTHFFFVPNRILWKGWEDFITGGKDGLAAPVAPTLNHKVSIGDILDHMGLPIGSSTQKISALPAAAYHRIYTDYYQDQNLQGIESWDLDDGDNNEGAEARGLFGVPFKRAWEHDYFTAALPFAQKGDTVTIPIAGSADINWSPVDNIALSDRARNPTTGSYMDEGDIVNEDNGYLRTQDIDTGTRNSASIDNSNHLSADLSTATQSTINDLRRAYRLQEWLEKQARGGTRYIEQIKMHFGVKSSDARMQRPEYLGGGKSPMVISEVLQTSESQETPQGNLAGHGINAGKSHSFSRSFEEHGFIIGIVSVMPKPAYSQGIPRQFQKFDKLDYFWPTFAHIGEQEIKNKELYVKYDDDDYNEGTFGYIPRYSEYRYNASTVHGDFRDTLDFWHMGRKFDTPPNLNASFIQCDPTNRIFAVQNIPDDGTGGTPVRDVNTMYCHMYHSITARRPIPKWGEPTL